MIWALPADEFIRAKRNCSTHEDIIKEYHTVSNRLKERAYDGHLIDRGRRLAENRDCSDLNGNSTAPKKRIQSCGSVLYG